LDALLQGTKWGGVADFSVSLTYSFPSTGSYWSTSTDGGYGPSTGSEEPWNNFASLTAAQVSAVKSVFNMISNFVNINFSETTDTSTNVGDLRFGFTGSASSNEAAHAYMPGGSYNTSTFEGTSYAQAGDVWINSNSYSTFSPTKGNYDYLVLIHEIGHALGLKHTFESSGEFPAIAPEYDCYDFSVMSYSAIAGNYSSSMSYYPTSMMYYDILALQYLYGANTSFNNTNTTYTFNSGYSYNEVIWDGGGVDTIVYQSSSDGCVIDLNGGSWQSFGNSLDYYDGGSGTGNSTSIFNVFLHPDVLIESATGGDGSDSISGNYAANKLLGKGGNDTISGEGGADTIDGGLSADSMNGGNGSDSYYVDNAGDIVIESNSVASTGGIDLVFSYLSNYILAANVENCRILSSGAANITGNALGNVLYAGSGVNVIDGSSGSDTVSFQYATTTGSAGVTLNLAAVDASGYSIAAGISGGDKVIRVENITGTNYADTLSGNSGNNVINGLNGNDKMAGGAGNDIYVVSTLSDVITELAGQGTDRIQSAISYSLSDTDGIGSNGGNVEDLQLTGVANINATGNGFNNVLFSNSGNNTLDGFTGWDTASYQYATTGVAVTLNTSAQQNTIGAGLDTLKNIDNLTGSNYGDTLTGTTMGNTITGLGGKDTMKGNGGADVFKFNAITDSAIDASRDVILDFGADDVINLVTIDANTVLAGDQAFTVLKTGVFSVSTSFTSADVGKLFFDTTSKILYGNTDADVAAEFSIQLTLSGVSTVTAADFVL